jgi:hypothetical protein
MYLSLACLPMLVSSAAYANAGVSAPPIALLPRIAGPKAQPASSLMPMPPVTTVLAPSSFEQLQSDLSAIAAQDGGWVGISLQDLSGPRRNTLSVNGSQSFYAASAYKLPLLMAEAQQVVAGEASLSDVLCFDPSDAEDGWFDDYDVGSCLRATSSRCAPGVTRTTRRPTSWCGTWAGRMLSTATRNRSECPRRNCGSRTRPRPTT